MNARTVLIVDDSESVCDSIASVLRLKGYTAVSVHDGAEGVRCAREQRPDVILMDLMMPVLDGWAAMRELKASLETADIPVLALTALRLSQARVDEAGFEGCLSKPVPAHRLTEELERACSRLVPATAQ